MSRGRDWRLRGRRRRDRIEDPIGISCGICGVAYMRAEPFPDWEGRRLWWPVCGHDWAAAVARYSE